MKYFAAAVSLLSMVAAGRTASGLSTRPARLAYVYRGDVYVKDLPDGRAQRLTRDGYNRGIGWSPSGRWIAFIHTGNSNTINDWHLCIVRSTGGQRRALADGVGSYAWSPVVDELAYIPLEGSLDVERPTDAHPRILVHERVKDVEDGQDRFEVDGLGWSRDGRWLAFTGLTSRERSGNPNRDVQLYLIRLDGRMRRRIYDPHDPGHAPSIAGWSPDDRCVLFWRYDYGVSSGNADGSPLYDISVRGGKPRLLTPPSKRPDSDDGGMMRNNRWLTFSPNGKTLTLAQGFVRFPSENKRIAKLAYATGRHVWLTDLRTAATDPAWSSDGRRIAYDATPDNYPANSEVSIVEREAKRRLWIMNADGSAKRRLTNDPRYCDDSPVWLPDGQHLLFRRSSNSQDNFSFWMIGSDGSSLRCVVETMASRDDSNSENDGEFDLWMPHR